MEAVPCGGTNPGQQELFFLISARLAETFCLEGIREIA